MKLLSVFCVLFLLSFLSCKHSGSAKVSSTVNSDQGVREAHAYKIDMVETKLHLGAIPKVCYYKYAYPVVKMLQVATRADLEFIESVNEVIEQQKLTPRRIEVDWYNTPCVEGDPATEIGFEAKNSYYITEKYVSFLGDFWTYAPGAVHPGRNIVAPVVDAWTGKLVKFSEIARPDSLEKIKEAIIAKASQTFDDGGASAVEFVTGFDKIQFTATSQELILHVLVGHAMGDVYSPSFTWDEAKAFLK